MGNSWSSTTPSAPGLASRLEQSPGSVQAGGWMDLRAALWMKSWGSWSIKTEIWAGSVHWHPRKPISPYSQKHCQQVKGCDTPPLVYFCETALGVLCPALGPLAQERQGTFGVSPEEGHKNNQRAGVPLPWGRTETVRVVQLKEKEGSGEHYYAPNHTLILKNKIFLIVLFEPILHFQNKKCRILGGSYLE